MVAGPLDPKTRTFYMRTLDLLDASGIPYLVGGAYSLAHHAGIERHTKDLDVFARPADRDRILGVLAGAGYRTEVTFPHWLAKAYGDDEFIDVIYGSGNGVAKVDDEWFAHAVEGQALGRPARLCPAEEVIWSKAFVMERERFDGADIAHVLRARADELDWARLLRRFGDDWRVLMAHLLLFGFVYPSERHRIPDWVTEQLQARLREEAAAEPPRERVCRGTFISREQYLIDIREWGYADARIAPRGPMSKADVDRWTDAIEASC